MFTVVDMKGNKIIWTDNKLCNNEEVATSRKEYLEKHYPKKNLHVICFTKYKFAS